ncbi:MAG TPA: 1-deoxy-D-xylulose-5-phosphate reductoisomerase [Euzebyales bacterium]|nr:1-deoxy-D-xylulose-5-phosphate reductoisomerase [Euzebyales bacterium]
MTRRITLLGSTGSIGTQALQVIAEQPERFRVEALAAGSNVDLLCEQARTWDVRRVALADPAAAADARARLPARVEVLVGLDGVTELAGAPVDVVLNGMVSSQGLRPTLAALAAGSTLALANKESLIVGGTLVTAAARPGQLVPVDSEHSALAQCLRAGSAREVARLVVTASGGPFRGWSARQLAGVTVEQALAHPTWNMGRVITINSATLANKGLEVIEAHLLFGVPYERIEVVVHPQSIVHGMVEFHDGAVVAKLSPPDMRLPIQLALAWPQRLPSAPARMDWTSAQDLTFEPLDRATFPMVDLAVAAGVRGGTAPAVLNAANEQAVAAFLEHRLPFADIPRVVEAVLEQHGGTRAATVDDVLDAERWARATADQLLDRRLGSQISPEGVQR